jgi:hypothetical protein
MKKFKVGVSNWDLFFQDGMVLRISTLLNEIVSMDSDGKWNIRLTDCVFHPDLKDMLLRQLMNPLVGVSQTYILYENSPEFGKEEFVCEYEGPFKMKRVSYRSSPNSVDTCDIHISKA